MTVGNEHRVSKILAPVKPPLHEWEGRFKRYVDVCILVCLSVSPMLRQKLFKFAVSSKCTKTCLAAGLSLSEPVKPLNLVDNRNLAMQLANKKAVLSQGIRAMPL